MRLPVIVLDLFLSGDGIADILADRYFNYGGGGGGGEGGQTNSQVIVSGVPSRCEKNGDG